MYKMWTKEYKVAITEKSQVLCAWTRRWLPQQNPSILQDYPICLGLMGVEMKI